MSDSKVSKIGKSIADRYCITGTIGEGGMGSVFEAIPFEDPSHTVAIKIIQRGKRLDSEDLLRFQKEASLMSQLNHPGIVTFYELGILKEEEESDFGNGYYIVMEVVNGGTLKRAITHDKRNDLEFFFQVGLQIASALDYTHGKDIIHRDIKPQNIIVGKAISASANCVVKILDFGVAKFGDAMHFTGGDKGGEEVAGTPLYMAPEQTQYLKAPIDHRVDLYSLGCLLFEILSGRPPFSGANRDELGEKHARIKPESLRSIRADVPQIVEDIVFKLLEKHPDDRYQTAFSVFIDLLRCQSFLKAEAGSREASLELALTDRYQAVSAKLKLYGRTTELKELVGAYEDVATKGGRSRISIVTGGSGIGKTRLLAEMRNYFKGRQIRFVSGSFSRHEAILSFNALANAFNEYLLKVLKGQPLESADLRKRFKTTMGSAAHSVASVVPGLYPYISDIAEPETKYQVDGVDFNTFAKAFSDFTRCLVLDSQPVVFIFDDLHWADEKSLKLIDLFFSNNNSQRFYLIISYHSAYADRNQGLHSFLEKFRKLRRRCQEMELKNLAVDDIARIAGNVLAIPDKIDDKFSTFLTDESRGNPRYLVELIRTLVELNLVSPQSQQPFWKFDYAGMRRQPILVGTIDLALGRIQKYQGYGKEVLETAAVCGISFYFESILLEGKIESLSAMMVLQDALNDGIIIDVPGDEGLRYLGKHYQFAHRKAREEIYDNIGALRRAELHRLVGGKAELTAEYTDSKSTFALAHHYLQGMSDFEDTGFANKCLKCLLEAGRISDELGSLQSSEKYYESALALVTRLGKAIGDQSKLVFITEKLADLSAKQRKHGKAIKEYRELLAMAPDTKTQLPIAFKVIHFQLVSGIVSESLRMIGHYLGKVGAQVPKVSVKNWYALAVSAASDLFGSITGRGSSRDILRWAAVRLNKGDSESNPRRMAAKLYQTAQFSYLGSDTKMALVCHILAYDDSRAGISTAERGLQAVVDRGILLAIFGFKKTGERILKLAIKIAEKSSCERVAGYGSIFYALFFEFNKTSKSQLSVYLNYAKEHLGAEEDRLYAVTIQQYFAYESFLQGDLVKAAAFSEAAFKTISTRSWLSPQSVALVLLSHLLRDERDVLVSKGELYLRRRAQVLGRKDDVFMNQINALVSLAKGDAKNSRTEFLKVVNQYCDKKGQQFLFPFEEDLVGLFLLIFPEVYMQEQGKTILRNSEMKVLYERLHRRIKSIFSGSKRDVPTLLMARIYTKLNVKKAAGRYRRAIGISRLTANRFVEMMELFWLGQFESEVGSGKKGVPALMNALTIARSLGQKAVSGYIEKALERGAVSFEKPPLSRDKTSEMSRFRRFPSALAKEHLALVSDVIGTSSEVRDDVSASIALFISHYGGTAAFCAVSPGEGKLAQFVCSYGGRYDQSAALGFVDPYMTINTTLFLHSSSLPWSQALASVEGVNNPPVVSVTASARFLDLDNSSVVSEDSGSESAAIDLGKTEVSDVATEPSQGQVRDSRGPQNMTVLIPLHNRGRCSGLLVVENIGLLFQRNVIRSRQEMDLFGAQLGLLIEAKSDRIESISSDNVDGENAGFHFGGYSLEPISWLKLWSKGELRRDRESTWYLGLKFSEDQYLLVFTLIMGDVLLRERLSTMIRHHIITIRSLCLSGKREVGLDEIRDDIAELISSFPGSAKLEKISIVATIFNGSVEKVISGHFGPIRPVVIGHEPEIKPINDAILHFDSGSDLRYWEVRASLAGNQPYLVSYDTSKLDGRYSEKLQQRLALGLTNATERVELHQILEKNLGVGVLPRCYVAGVMVKPKGVLAA